MTDPCGWCGKKVRVADDVWKRMKSVWARVVTAPYCSAECVMAAHKNPQTAAHLIGKRSSGAV
jgi:hypothetical protein